MFDLMKIQLRPNEQKKNQKNKEAILYIKDSLFELSMREFDKIKDGI